MQITTIHLDIPLHPGDISALRSAIAEKVGLENELFHNHDNNSGKDHLHFGYPKVQYQVQGGRAAIVALGEAVDQVQNLLLPKLYGELAFAGKRYTIRGFNIKFQDYQWRVQSNPNKYGLVHWMALNKNNYDAWKKAPGDIEKMAVLNKALTGHLRSFARAAGLPYEEIVTGEVLEIHNKKKMQWHGNELIGFHALISTNLSLPKDIGLGRLTAFGFGSVQPVPVYRRYVEEGVSVRSKSNPYLK